MSRLPTLVNVLLLNTQYTKYSVSSSKQASKVLQSKNFEISYWQKIEF